MKDNIYINKKLDKFLFQKVTKLLNDDLSFKTKANT